MTVIVFKPWFGSRYRSGSVRLLLVGDSHYGEPDVDPGNATQTVVSKWKSGAWSVRYLIAAARVLTGKNSGEIDRQVDLEEIAFYNFVQVMMPWHDVRPTTNEYQASQPAFLEALIECDPTHVLVTGKTVWWNLPKGGEEHELTFNGEPMPHRVYPTASGTAVATRIPHLSRYFSPTRWHPPVRAFLASRSSSSDEPPSA